jgi:polyribonucleotide nucleotidyltransferase
MSIIKKEFSVSVGNKDLVLEVSSLAEQANAAVLAKYGETVVLATAVMGSQDVTLDYLPLKVDYEERYYAAGKILGSRFMRREGRPSEDAVLSGRLIDRTIRPLFDHRLRRDIQVVMTVLAYDEQNDPDFVGLMAVSTALAISDIPWKGPVAGVRIAKIGGEFVVNPTHADLDKEGTLFETFASGPKDRINMIELGGKEASEEDVAAAFTQAQKEINQLIEFQNGVVKEIGKQKAEVKLYAPDAELRKEVETFLSPKLEQAVYAPTKMEQGARLGALKQELLAHLETKFEKADHKAADFVMEEMIDDMIHSNILEKERRPDGRAITEVRKLDGQIGLFKRTHGSAFFVRGNTQALAMTTLAAPGQEQLIESMANTEKRRFMLHYNFPPYSVGEVGRMGSPGRREIGHGALAEKALRPMIPSTADFPYTIRIVSEILSSNGSSSMATVCASTLSLMDAGVPMKKPVAGIAMGLMMTEDASKFKVLTDLQGPEDHWGDMDFKVAGTEQGITAVQLDVKVSGLTPEIIRQTLSQAKDARMQILGFMKTVITAPREKLSEYVPTIIQLSINPDKIGMVIGPGGKMINGLIDRYALTTIDIDDDGSVYIAGPDRAKAEECATEIRMMTREIKVGEIVEGRVLKALDFGAIVDLGGGKDGMIHVSELAEGFVKSVNDVVKVGDFVRAKVIRVEDDRIGLSIKQLTPEQKA